MPIGMIPHNMIRIRFKVTIFSSLAVRKKGDKISVFSGEDGILSQWYPSVNKCTSVGILHHSKMMMLMRLTVKVNSCYVKSQSSTRSCCMKYKGVEVLACCLSLVHRQTDRTSILNGFFIRTNILTVIIHLQLHYVVVCLTDQHTAHCS